LSDALLAKLFISNTKRTLSSSSCSRDDISARLAGRSTIPVVCGVLLFGENGLGALIAPRDLELARVAVVGSTVCTVSEFVEYFRSSDSFLKSLILLAKLSVMVLKLTVIDN
jgi:hypothetical protein